MKGQAYHCPLAFGSRAAVALLVVVTTREVKLRSEAGSRLGEALRTRPEFEFYPESHGKPPKDVFVSDDGTVFPVGDQTVVARMAW